MSDEMSAANLPPAPPVDRLDASGVPAGPDPTERGRKRAALWIAGLLALVMVGGGAAVAWQMWFGQGPQPAEALPADTLVYVSVDLDPSGKQKVEALRTLRKFPGFRDEVKIDSEADLRKELFSDIQSEGLCPDVDYDADVASWLGDRMGVALLPGKSGHLPEPIAVLQVTDRDKADKSIGALLGCDSFVGEKVEGHALSGDWLVIARTDDIAQKVVDDAERKSLADDDDFKRWTDEIGDPGIVNGYSSPNFGEAFLDALQSGKAAELFGDEFGGRDPMAELPPGFEKQMAGAGGGAFVVRFNDGGLEFEAASEASQDPLMSVLSSGSRGGDAAASLPISTVAALGFGLPDGWAEKLMDEIRPMVEAETGMSLDEAIAEAEQETGLDLPEDVETLLGDSIALVVDSSIASLDLTDDDQWLHLPVGLKITGDADEIEAVLDKVLDQVDADSIPLIVRQDGDHVFIGLDDAYLDELAKHGNLGKQRNFRAAVPNASQASYLFFIDFDVDDWMTDLARSFDDELADNLEPLSYLGVSSWTDDDVAHMLVKLSTD